MYPATLFTTAALLATTGVLAQNSTVQCAEGLKMFVARGTGEPMGLGATEALVDIIAEQINGSDIEAIEYPATMDDPVYFFSVANGTMLVKQAITNYAMACPGSKMAVFGYSQGAQITSNTLCGTPPIWAVYALGTAVGIPEIMAFAQPLPANITQNGKVPSKTHFSSRRLLTKRATVVSVVLFGDPSHRDDATYNRGNSTGSGMFWRHDISACEAMGSRIRSYCDSGDPFCSVGPDSDALTHVTYLERHSSDISRFVVDQYNNGGASNTSNTANPSPTTGSVTVSESGRHSVMITLVMTTALFVIGLI